MSLLQEKVGFGAALGRHSITTRPFLAARTFFTGLCSNVGAQAEKGHYGLFISNLVEYALIAGMHTFVTSSTFIKTCVYLSVLDLRYCAPYFV